MPMDEMRVPPGLPNAALFFGVVAIGALYIIVAKLAGFHAFAITAVPVLIMVGYAVLLAAARLVRLRDDQAGDNLYYMGFLFTLTSLAVSLYQFSATGSAELIVQNFGIAIASTIAGIALRIFFNQMRRDPVEAEHTARLELADAARRVRRELDSTVLEFSHFRRATQQSIREALKEVTDALNESKGRVITELEAFARASKKPLEEAAGQSVAAVKEASDRLSRTIDGTAAQIQGAGSEFSAALSEARGLTVNEFESFAKASKKPLEEAAGQSGAVLNSMNERLSETIRAATTQIQGAGSELAKSAAAVARSIDGVVAKLEAMKTPEQVVEIKLTPTISGLTRAVNGFAKNAELQAKAVDANLAQTQALSADIATLVEEMRGAQEPAGRPPPVTSDGAPHPSMPDRKLNI
jgi:translation initiation factor 2 alpha subunit (eIF-2alpha)